jgi:hypothetical protein
MIAQQAVGPIAGIDSTMDVLPGEAERGFSYQNLMQELLLGLLGYTGDVFVDDRDTG